MITTLLLAEGAARHADGTVSVLRAGLNRATGPSLPIPLRAAIVILFDTEDPRDVGLHTFTVRCVGGDDEGRQLVAPIEETFGVSGVPAHHALAIPIAGRFVSRGKVRWLLEVDGQVVAERAMMVETIDAEGDGDGDGKEDGGDRKGGFRTT